MGTHALTHAVSEENLRAPQPLPRHVWTLAVLERLEFWLDRHSQRRALRELDAAALKDLGLAAADAARESGKPFWRP